MLPRLSRQRTAPGAAADFLPGFDEPIPQPLMIAFLVKMNDELPNRPAERDLPEKDHLRMRRLPSFSWRTWFSVRRGERRSVFTLLEDSLNPVLADRRRTRWVCHPAADEHSCRIDCIADLLSYQVLEQVEGTGNASNSLARHMCVDYRRFQTFM